MKVIYLNENSPVYPIEPGLIVALGYFDGLHLAHQHIIKKAVDEAKQTSKKSAVMTFHPSPKLVLGREEHEYLLTPHNKKIDILNQMGVDYLIVVSFNIDLTKMKHKQFVDTFITPLNVKHIITGFDFRYGHQGKGNVETLKEAGEGQFEVTVIDEIQKSGEKISSSKIRQLIINGHVDQVKDYLGRYYQTEGIVIHGFKRGRELGYPTANILMQDRFVSPGTGVYVVMVELFKQKYIGMCSVGYNPTFSENNNKSIEVNILDFNQDIYNEKMTVTWLYKMRDEVKFPSVDALIEQLAKDEENTRTYMANFNDYDLIK